MHIQGLDYISQLTSQDYFQAKLVFNTHGAIFFPVTKEHRNQSGPNICYADDYKGNALAAMISPGKIEVRFHREYTDAQVAQMLTNLLAHESCTFLWPVQATYQGRPLQI
jgi:hypothetical protein